MRRSNEFMKLSSNFCATGVKNLMISVTHVLHGDPWLCHIKSKDVIFAAIPAGVIRSDRDH